MKKQQAMIDRLLNILSENNVKNEGNNLAPKNTSLHKAPIAIPSSKKINDNVFVSQDLNKDFNYKSNSQSLDTINKISNHISCTRSPNTTSTSDNNIQDVKLSIVQEVDTIWFDNLILEIDK